MYRILCAALLLCLAAFAQSSELRYEALLDAPPSDAWVKAPRAISPDGTHFAAGAADGSVSIWRLDRDDPPRRAKLLNGAVAALAFDATGILFAVGNHEASALSLPDLKATPMVWPHGPVPAFAISRDAIAIPAGSANEVQVHSRATGQILRRYTGHSSPIHSIAFSPEGERIATGELFRIARIWSTHCNCLQQNVSNRSTDLDNLSFSRDGRWLVAVSESSVQVADAVSGREMQRFHPRSGSFLAAALDANGAVVAVSSDAGLRVSRSEPLPFVATPPSPRPTLHILVAGINAYADPSLHLGFAQQDASDLAAIFEQNALRLPYQPRATRILGDCATKEELVAAFRELALTAKPGDAVIVFLAGHGRQDAGDFWFYTHRFRKLDRVPGEALSSSEIASLMAAVPASRQILIVEACQSGTAVERFAQAFSRRAPRGRNLQVLSASAASEAAMEVEELGHGVLTAALLERLRSRLESGLAETASGLLEFATGRVPDIAAQYDQRGQKPTRFSTGADFPLFAVGANSPRPSTARAPAVARSATPPEFNGKLSCRPTASDRVFVRPEGMTELIGDIAFRCGGGVTAPVVSVEVYFNTNFTSRDLGSGQIAALLVAEKPGTRSEVTAAQARSGRIFLPNALRWDNVPIPATSGVVDVQFRITGMRVNANQLGASSSLIPSQAVSYYVVRAEGLEMKQQATVAYIAGPLRPAAADCGGEGNPPGAFQSTLPQNLDLARGTAKEGNLQLAIHFNEAYPEHFLPAAARLKQRALPNGLALTAESMDQGTRLMFTVDNLPPGLQLYATVANLPGPSSSTIRARMVAADANGSGPYQPVKGEGVGKCGGSDLGIARLATIGTHAKGVWEVTGADPNQLERLSFGLMVAYSEPPGLGQVLISATYAPLSTVSTASNRAAIPRFGPVGFARNLFRVEPPTSRLLFPVVANAAGFDSEVRIRNTAQTAGICTLNFIPTPQSGAKPEPERTNAPLEPNATLRYSFSEGGGLGLKSVPGFSGCLEAICYTDSIAGESRIYPWDKPADSWTPGEPLGPEIDAKWIAERCKLKQSQFKP